MSSWFNKAITGTKAITRSWMSSTRSGTKYTLFPSLPFSNRRKKNNEAQPSPQITGEDESEKLLVEQPPQAEQVEKTLPDEKIEINPQTTKIEEKLNAIVPVSVKQNQAFKNELAYLTRSDAHHDLGDLFKDSMYKKDDKVRDAYNAGIPAAATVAFHEGDALASVIISAIDANGATINIHTGNNHQEEYLQEALDKVPDCTQQQTQAYSSFAIGIGGETIFKYRVVKFVTKCSNNSKMPGLEEKACRGNFGKNFFNNTKLGEDGSEAAIIVDFSQHHFIEDLASGEKERAKTIYYLMTPEVVNDPAGKPNVNNRSLFGVQDKGINLYSWVQSDPEPITYTKYNEYEPNTANNFFSNYNFELSPIKQIFTKQKAEKLIATLNISYDGGDNGKPLTDTIEDSKGENSITTVLGYLKKILAQIQGTGGTSIEKFNFNSKIQQKRGGDWFQALSCLTAKNRTYTQILPASADGSRPPVKLNQSCPVYLVTHDRIAVAFALLNGVNVIYLDYYGRIFIFKNGGDPTLKSSGKSMEEILFDGIKENWKFNGQLFTNVVTTATAYNSARNTYIQEENEAFNNNCQKLISQVRSINASNDRNFQENARIVLRSLFKDAVKLAFMNLNLIDIKNDLAIVTNETNQRIFNGAYNQAKASTISSFSKALNNLKGIIDRYGSIASGQADAFKNILRNWVNDNAVKLDVYKVANRALEGLNDNSTSFSIDRLLSVFNRNNTDERKTDIHIFLPFIQILNIVNKNQIVSVINELVNKTSEYYTNIVVNSPGRSGRISPQQAYYNGVANLLYESFLFLKIEEAPVEANEIRNTKQLVTSNGKLLSSDNIILNEDYKDLSIVRGSGKPSANTENSDAVQQGGASYMSMFDGTRRKDNIICDVSVKQVTWTLLSVFMLETNPQNIINSASDFRNLDETGNNVYVDEYINRINRYIIAGDVAIAGLGVAAETAAYKYIQDFTYSSTLGMAIVGATAVADGLWRYYMKKGGGDSDLSSSPSLPPIKITTNFDLGFHPLTPIYSMLSSYYNTIAVKSDSDPFFYTYFTYINILEKMKKTLEENYLTDTTDKVKCYSAYIISYGVYTMLFTSHTSILQNKQILDTIQMTQEEYSEFSLKNDGFASLFTGAIHQTPEEEVMGMFYVNNKLFNNFINNEVNIKQILEQGTPVENLPTSYDLKERMFKLMGEIVVKVNEDRDTPIGASTSASASGIPGLSVEEQAARAARGQQKYEESLAKGIVPRKTGLQDTSKLFTYSEGQPSNVVTSTTSSSIGRRGGKRSKRYINKKRKITKRKKGGKTNKNKTLKKVKVYRKTRKH
jgi:hypothetical protein